MLCGILLALSATVPTPGPSQQPPQVSKHNQQTEKTESQTHTGKDDAEAHSATQQNETNSGDIEHAAGRPEDGETQERIAKSAERQVWATWTMVCVTLLTGVVVAMYTCFAREQAKTMARALEFGSRSWIAVHAIDSTPPAGIPLKCVVWLKNAGHATAKGTIDMWLQQLGASEIPEWERGAGAMVPDGPPANFIAASDQPVKAGFYHLPQKINWENITSGKESLWLMIQVSYWDEFKKERISWTTARLTFGCTGQALWEFGPPDSIRLG